MVETPSPDDLQGRVLGGRYRVERPLRRGGMGQVYAGVDVEAGNAAVAVKVVRQALLEDPQALARFKREARLVTELKHENIVRSMATGEDGGLLWIAMELVQGESLRERIDARGRMSWQESLPVIEQVVRALSVAHDKGIIHRDLKPENVMLDGAGNAKLLDFGVAKQAHIEGQSGTSNMTGTGLIVGTPGYVAPEVVLEGRTDDPRSDFYALGVTWFEMLTAQKPFTAKTAFALAMRHAHEAPPTPTSFVPYSPVPAPIERLVLRLMAKNPDDRPQNAAALRDALRNLADESQRALTSPTPPPESLEPHAPTMTATDLGKPSTGVVPFKTPMPPGPSSSSQTPSTFVVQGTPQPADVAAQLVAMIPKKKVAAAAVLGVFALLVVIVGVTVAVVITVNRQQQPPLQAATTAAAVAGAHDDATDKKLAQMQKELEKATSEAARAKETAEKAAAQSAARDAQKAEEDRKRTEERVSRIEAREARREGKDGKRDVEVAAASAGGTAVVNIGCTMVKPDHPDDVVAVSVFLDGRSLGNAPATGVSVSVGKHKVRFLVLDGSNAEHVEEMDVKADTRKYRCAFAAAKS